MVGGRGAGTGPAEPELGRDPWTRGRAVVVARGGPPRGEGSGLVALGLGLAVLGGLALGGLGGLLVGLLALDAGLGLGLGELGLEGLRGDGLRHVDDERLGV